MVELRWCSFAFVVLAACPGSRPDGNVADAPRSVDSRATVDAPTIVAFQSCTGGGPGKSTCGPTANDNCCSSLDVTGGTFDRSYDGVSFTDTSAPATVSGFALDKYEITVGRFRAFTRAVDGGWTPGAGDGKHAYLTGGGLNAGAEAGWQSAWTSNLGSAWDTNLACAGGTTWTSAPGANEAAPITCATWYELYAFCIWDGGFLPSEAEWDYAAAGGSDQRVFPWSSPASSTGITCSDANYASCGAGIAMAGSATASGAGKWGQMDLAGNVWERTLDVYSATYTTPSVDGATLSTASGTARVLRGGSYVSSATANTLTTSFRNNEPDTARDQIVGARCARAPM